MSFHSSRRICEGESETGFSYPSDVLIIPFRWNSLTLSLVHRRQVVAQHMQKAPKSPKERIVS